MPPKQSLDQRRFPVTPELRTLQAFCGGLEAGGYNQANFESPWYMFLSCALSNLLSTPPESELAGPPSSRTGFAIAPQYIFSLPRERTQFDAQAEDKIRKNFNRIPDFVVWSIDGAPHRPSRSIDEVRTKEHAIEYFKGTCNISEAALLLCVEVKSLPDLRVSHVVADLPHSLKKAERDRLSEAQVELTSKLVVHFSSHAEGEEVVVLACAGSRFTWNVAVRKGSDVLSTVIPSSEEDSSYLSDLEPALTKSTTAGITNTRANTTGDVPSSQSERPKRAAAVRGAAFVRNLVNQETKGTADQFPSETRAVTDKGKKVAISQKSSGHDDDPKAGPSEDGRENSGKEAKPIRKKPSELRVAFKKRTWSPPKNWNDEDAAPQKAKLWEAIRQANPGIEFWK